MARSNQDMAAGIADAWDREANALERQAKDAQHSGIERRLLDMHARVKRGCANELRTEARKVIRA